MRSSAAVDDENADSGDGSWRRLAQQAHSTLDNDGRWEASFKALHAYVVQHGGQYPVWRMNGESPLV